MSCASKTVSSPVGALTLVARDAGLAAILWEDDPPDRVRLGPLRTIPFGETRSYAAIARQIGRPGASRAVGAANGRNPVSIITPCHRVVGATGALTGFAGGLAVKTRLLAHERGQGSLAA